MIRRREGCVLVHAGDRTTVVFPEEDLNIGLFREDDALAVGYVRGEGWERPYVRLDRAGETAGEWRGARLATRP